MKRTIRQVFFHFRQSAAHGRGNQSCFFLLFFSAIMVICPGCDLFSSQTKDRPVVFVIDTFEGHDSHGENVSDTLSKSCYGTGEIRDISLGAAVKRDNYLYALETILQFASEHPARHIIVNMSFGSTSPDPQEKGLIEKMVGKGMILVAAAGNENNDKPMFPAAYPGVLAIAAVDMFGQKETYSNYGKYIGVAAGGFLKSKVVSRELKMVGPYSREYVRYLITGGTSFAAPRVSGLAALIWYRMPSLSSSSVLNAILQTSTPLPDNPYFLSGSLGRGEINEYDALFRMDSGFRRLVQIFYVSWLPYLAIWLTISYRSWQRQDLFGPFAEGLLIAIFILVFQFYAIWIWGEITGRYAGLMIWGIVALLAVGVYIHRKREEAFVRNYRFDPELLRQLSEVNLDESILRLRRSKLLRYLIRREKIRPDLAERMISLNFGDGEFLISQELPPTQINPTTSE